MTLGIAAKGGGAVASKGTIKNAPKVAQFLGASEATASVVGDVVARAWDGK